MCVFLLIGCTPTAQGILENYCAGLAHPENDRYKNKRTEIGLHLIQLQHL